MTGELGNPLMIALIAVFAVLLILVIRLSAEMRNLKKKYAIFMGSERKPSATLESLVLDYASDVKRLKEKYRSMHRKIREVEDNMGFCIRKIGIVRYNPFDEMGGNLSFAVALLNEKDDGVVLNGIHGRNGSFTYAKPVENGKSKYVLSQEEEAAINDARESVINNPIGKIKLQRMEKVYHIKKIIKNSENQEKPEEKIEERIEKITPPEMQEPSEPDETDKL